MSYDFYISEMDFEPKLTYYFYDVHQRKFSIRCNQKLKSGQTVFFNNFIHTEVMQVEKVWEESDQLFVVWKPVELPMCVLKQKEGRN